MVHAPNSTRTPHMPTITNATTASIITDTDRSQLLTNGDKSQHDSVFDPPPVTKLFMPDGPGTWLLANSTQPNATAPSVYATPARATRNSTRFSSANCRQSAAAFVSRLSATPTSFWTDHYPNTREKRGRPAASPPEQTILHRGPRPTTATPHTQPHNATGHPDTRTPE